ncbi:hypothetical protein VTO42DRAFT_8056 [Malbranchea cinnamomea]
MANPTPLPTAIRVRMARSNDDPATPTPAARQRRDPNVTDSDAFNDAYVEEEYDPPQAEQPRRSLLRDMPRLSGFIDTINNQQEALEITQKMAGMFVEYIHEQHARARTASAPNEPERSCDSVRESIQEPIGQRHGIPAPQDDAPWMAGADQEERDVLAALYGYELDPNSKAGRAITSFRERVKLVKKPVSLSGAATYPAWRQSVLQAARQAGPGVENIIARKQYRAPQDDYETKTLWNKYNSWLYDFMWTSVSAQAFSHFTPPNEPIAFALWEILEIIFSERPQTTRRRLIRELSTMTSKQMGGDHPYIERLLAIRTELQQLGFPLPDFVYFDFCMLGISARYREFLQNRMDQAVKDEGRLPEEDFVTTLRDILTRLQDTAPHTNNGNLGSDKNPTNAAKDTKNEDAKADDNKDTNGGGSNRGGHQGRGRGRRRGGRG